MNIGIRWRTAAIGVAMLLLAGGCARTPPPRITSDHLRVPGILETAAARKRDRVTLFLIHGMGPTAPCYAEDVANMMMHGPPRPPGGCSESRLVTVCLDDTYVVSGEGLPRKDEVHPECAERSAAAPAASVDGTAYSGFGQLMIQSFPTSYRGKPIDVTLFSYYWENDAWDIEYPYVAADLNAPARAKANRALKTFVNYGFSDAVLYSGGFGLILRQATRSALCLAALESDPARAPLDSGHPIPSPCALLESAGGGGLEAIGDAHFAILTKSLGSRILFDALSDGDPGRSESAAMREQLATLVIDSSPVIYMSANQLPLLGLSQLEVSRAGGPGATATGSSERSFLGRFLSGSSSLADPSARSRQIIAFYDPNDPLGYQAGAHLVPPELAANIVEVTQYYARPWFGLAADPRAAHDQSFVDPVSRRIILCGAEQREGKLVAQDCR